MYFAYRSHFLVTFATVKLPETRLFASTTRKTTHSVLRWVAAPDMPCECSFNGSLVSKLLACSAECHNWTRTGRVTSTLMIIVKFVHHQSSLLWRWRPISRSNQPPRSSSRLFTPRSASPLLSVRLSVCLSVPCSQLNAF